MTFIICTIFLLSNCVNKKIASISVNTFSNNSQKIANKKNRNISFTTNAKYKLVWADEFDKAGAPDSTKWSYDIGTGTWGWGNNEKEYYTNRSQNVEISNGILKISAVKENYNGSAYTSTRMHTKDKFNFTYGKIEVKAKLPAGVGTWPAIWMLGSNIKTAGWPQCGEIDIMEHKGSELNKIYSTLHYPNHFGENGDGNTSMIKNVTTSFHIYTVEWTANDIKFYADDVVIKTFTNSPTTPFNQQFHIILNLAMGGNFAGTIDTSVAKASMEVDYVRVYQK